MNFLLVSGEYPPAKGGIGRYAANLVSGLGEAGASVQVIAMAGEGQDSEESMINRVPAIFNRKFLRLFPLVPMVLWRALMNRPQYLIAMTWTHDGLATWIASTLLRIPYVLHVHGSDVNPVRRGKLRGIVRSFVMRGASVLVANSEFTKLLVDDIGNFERQTVTIRPSATRLSNNDQIPVDESESDAIDRVVLLTVARLYRRKGHALVLRALGDLVDQYSLIYKIAGDGPERANLEPLVAQLGLGDHVEFLGERSDNEIDALYRSADIYISPSLEDRGDVEGFGISFIEAALHGVPSITAYSGGSAEAVVDGITGIVVQSGDQQGVTCALKTFLDDPSIRKRMGQAALIRAENEFSPRRQADELISAIENL